MRRQLGGRKRVDHLLREGLARSEVTRVQGPELVPQHGEVLREALAGVVRRTRRLRSGGGACARREGLERAWISRELERHRRDLVRAGEDGERGQEVAPERID